MKKANVALGILASIPFVALILVVCVVGYFSNSRIRTKALGGPRAIVEVDKAVFTRGFVGIQYESTSEKEAARLEVAGGITITSVVPGSPADKSGLAVGDCIVEVDGIMIASRDDLASLSADWLPDEVVELSVVGHGAGGRVERVVKCRLISYDELAELSSTLPARP
jgi:S1-C subfamily serine protease